MQPSEITPCLEMYEPDARPHDTHTCSLRAGHPLPHRCPMCHSEWDTPGGIVTQPGQPVSK